MRTVFAAAVVALAMGCGDDAAAGADGGSTDAGPADAGDALRDAATDGGPVPDSGGPLRPEDCTATWLEHIHGTVVDESGAPIPGARPQACLRSPADSLVCLAPPT